MIWEQTLVVWELTNAENCFSQEIAELTEARSVLLFNLDLLKQDHRGGSR